MRRMINLVLAVTLILSIIPVGVTAQDDVTYVPKWVNNVVGDTTVIVSDDYGSLWVVGTSEGYVYIFDKEYDMGKSHSTTIKSSYKSYNG